MLIFLFVDKTIRQDKARIIQAIEFSTENVFAKFLDYLQQTGQ